MRRVASSVVSMIAALSLGSTGFAVGAAGDAAGPAVVAQLNPPNASAPSAFGVVGPGAVSVIVPHRDLTYIGGSFDELAAMTGPFARLHATSARRIAPLAEVQNGEVFASVPDGNGGFYIGGAFTRVESETRNLLAHILPDGSLDGIFDAGISGTSVNAIALSDDRGIVYIGGRFTFVNGVPRNNLAAVDARTGAPINFNPAGLGTDGAVFALEVAGTQVYVGGQFDKLGGQVRNGLAKVAATTGGDLGWVPNPTRFNNRPIILAIEAAGDSVYVGGDFSSVGGQPRTNLARLSATTGAAFQEFAPNPDGRVFSIALSGSTVYAGGDFRSISGQSRPALARLDAVSGVLTSFNAGLPSTDGVRALAFSGADLFIGGFLSSVGGQPRVALAKIDATSGAVRPFDAGVGDDDTTQVVYTLAVLGTSVYAGGDITFVNRVTRHGIAALDGDGIPTSFNPDAGVSGPGVSNDVNAIAIRGNAIYLGGNFRSMGGVPRNRIAKVALNGSVDPSFNPNATGGDVPGVDAIVVTDTDVYAGGDFSSIGGQPRLDLAKLNPATGLVDGGRQSFDPDPLNGINPSRVRTLQVAGDAVYVGGDFTTIGGRSRSKIALISGTTGDVDVRFDANIGGGSAGGPRVNRIVRTNGALYVGGDFTSIGGAARNHVAALDAAGAALPGFNPNVTGGTRPQVFDLVVTNDEVYVGGSFTSVGGQPRSQLARVAKTGAVEAFNPGVSEPQGPVLALALWGTTLHAGGEFVAVGGRTRPKYAQFTETSPGDSDGDGVPDAWERLFGFDVTSRASGHAAGDPDRDGLTNAQEHEFGTHPRGFEKRYLAEGATSGFFQTQLALLNPWPDAQAHILLHFQKGDGSTLAETLVVEPRSRATLNVGSVTGMSEAEFSTAVESDVPIVVDRTMSWDRNGYGAHAESAVTAPALTWYLAEGATHSHFNLFYLVQNPNAAEAQVRVRFLRPSGAPLEKTYTLSAGSRTTIWVDVEEFPGLGRALEDTDVSAVFDVLNGQPIIVERAMYSDVPGQTFGAGHESAGITAASLEWFLAEGATGNYFDLFVLIANPGNTDAQLEATFLLPDGTTLVQPYTVAANSRFNIWVDHAHPLLANTAVSTKIRSTNGVPIIVERAMWWPGPTSATWAEAHNAAGSTTTGTRWALAEGEVDADRGVETFVLVANASASPATVRVTLLFEDGTSAEQTYANLPGSSRFNVPVGSFFPEAANRRFGVIVESLGVNPAQIVVERAMYWDAVGQEWAAGSNALGTRLP